MDSQKCSADGACDAYGPMISLINPILEHMPEPMIVILVGNFLSLIIFLCFMLCKTTPPPPKSPKGPRALQPEHEVDLVLTHREEVSHDTRIFRFKLPSENHVLGLPVGQHVSLSYIDDNGKMVSRSYTPVSRDDDLGIVDLLIKVYFANVHPKYPNGGMMSQYLDKLSIGDSVTFRGPKGRLEYKARGEFTIRKLPKEGQGNKRKTAKHIGMIAGGTGITPMYQIIQAIMKDEHDKTKVSLISANQTEEDILLGQELENMALDRPSTLKLWYTLDRPGEGWKYDKGFVTKEMLKQHMPPPGRKTLILMCGPRPMITACLVPSLKELGYTEDMYFAF